jgi:type IV secretion system protein VirD4
VIKNLASMTGSSKHKGRQLNLETLARRPSRVYGRASLANRNSRVIKSLSTRKGFFIGMLEGVPLFFDPFAKRKGNMLAYAPARGGKSTGIVIPAALSWFGGSLFLPDIKGEISAICAKLRSKRQRILIWNPFNVLGRGGKSFNPLDILIKDINRNAGKNLHDLARLIALTLIPDAANEKDPFFRKGGRRFLTALILYIAVIEKGKCHLPGLREMVWSDAQKKADIIAALKQVNGYGGLLKEYGNYLEEILNPLYAKTFGAMRDFSIDATQVYDAYSDFGKSLMGRDFSLDEILDGKTSFFPIIPEEKLDTHGNVIGLIAALLIENVAQKQNPHPLMMVLEEMGNIGVIPNLKKGVTLLGFKKIRFYFIAQSKTQLIQLYGEDNTSLFEEQCSMKQQWAIRDPKDCETWSTRSGTKTVKTNSLQFDPNDKLSPWKTTITETERPVLTPYDVVTLQLDKMLIAVSGQPVIKADLVPYYQIEPWRSRASLNPYHPQGYPKDEPVLFDFRSKKNENA